MAHYFDKDPKSKSDPFSIEVLFNQKKYSFISDHGVFSKNHFDTASKLLCETIHIEPKSHVCDLGCGYGIIGLLLEQSFDITLTMIDINERAIACAVQNKESLNSNATVIHNDGFENMETSFDIIVSNPPVRVGKKKLYALIDDGLKHLNENGRFYFVMHKKHGVDSLVRHYKVSHHVEIIAQSKGFKVGYIQ